MVGIKLTPHTMSSIEMGIPDDAGDTNEMPVPTFVDLGENENPDDTVETPIPDCVRMAGYRSDFKDALRKVFKTYSLEDGLKTPDFLNLRAKYEKILGCSDVHQVLVELAEESLN